MGKGEAGVLSKDRLVLESSSIATLSLADRLMPTRQGGNNNRTKNTILPNLLFLSACLNNPDEP
jgi:hypothetical protein